YPALIALAMRLGARPIPAGVAISAGFEIALLALLWNRLFVRKNPLALLACALAPGALYFHAMFPISMCAFFVVLCLSFLLEDRFALAGLAGAAAAFSYSTGFLVAPVAVAWALTREGPVAQRASRAALVLSALVLLDEAPPAVVACVCAFLGTLAWLIVQFFFRGTLV